MSCSSRYSILVLLFVLPLSCSQTTDGVVKGDEASWNNEYWYSGLAEVNTYELSQARYGEMRSGTAALIFVTEPFLIEEQVKSDYPDSDPDNVMSVLKCNLTKQFHTGIYPYSIMTSVFTPVDKPQTPVKVVSSCQEWCGTTYSQVNLK